MKRVYRLKRPGEIPVGLACLQSSPVYGHVQLNSASKSKSPLHEICIDSGSCVSLIDEKLAKPLSIQSLDRNYKISLGGFSNANIEPLGFVSVNLFFPTMVDTIVEFLLSL